MNSVSVIIVLEEEGKLISIKFQQALKVNSLGGTKSGKIPMSGAMRMEKSVSGSSIKSGCSEKRDMEN